jgi:molybdopterin-guanine dinucleotide biosynthesis protein A
LVRDEVAYQGPVGGIYYGLKAAGGELSFVTSCDVAFVNAPLISNLRTRRCSALLAGSFKTT